MASVTFLDLESDLGTDGRCAGCFILIEVDFVVIRVDAVNQVSDIGASVSYDPVDMEVSRVQMNRCLVGIGTG
jgi:hypothetical protein